MGNSSGKKLESNDDHLSSTPAGPRVGVPTQHELKFAVDILRRYKDNANDYSDFGNAIQTFIYDIDRLDVYPTHNNNNNNINHVNPAANYAYNPSAVSQTNSRQDIGKMTPSHLNHKKKEKKKKRGFGRSSKPINYPKPKRIRDAEIDAKIGLKAWLKKMNCEDKTIEWMLNLQGIKQPVNDFANYTLSDYNELESYCKAKYSKFNTRDYSESMKKLEIIKEYWQQQTEGKQKKKGKKKSSLKKKGRVSRKKVIKKKQQSLWTDDEEKEGDGVKSSAKKPGMDNDLSSEQNKNFTYKEMLVFIHILFCLIE